MAELNVALPYSDGTNSIEIAENIEAVTLDGETKIFDAFKNKNNSLHIIINATAEGNMCVKPGDNYPNAMLGECWFHVSAGFNDIIIEDISRFENRDGSIVLGKSDELAATVFAVAKRAGLRPVG